MKRVTNYGTLIVPGLDIKRRRGVTAAGNSVTATGNSVDVVTSGDSNPYSRGRLPAAVGRYIYEGGLAYLLRDDGKVTMKYAIKTRDGHYYLRSGWPTYNG